MAKKGDVYFGWHIALSIILAIIPITSLILGIVTRIQKKNFVGAVLNLLTWPYFWIVDLITVILYKNLLLIDVKF